MSIMLTFCIFPGTYAFANPAPISQTEPNYLELLKHNETADIYFVYTATDLNLVSMAVKNGNNFLDCEIKVMEDIDFNGNSFSPIGNSETPFFGNFNGNNHTINNIKASNQDKEYCGLFGYVGPYGIVRNLTLGKNSTITGNNYTGGIVGYNCGVIDHCCFKGNIICSDYNVENNNCTGGIVGYNAHIGYINNCRLSKSSKILQTLESDQYNIANIYGVNKGNVLSCEMFSLFPW